MLVPNGGEDDVAELYDPATGTWSVTASIPGGRWRYTATLLANGKVLVAGGTDGRTGLPAAFAHLYDPSSGTWTETGALIEGRARHSATLLPDGRFSSPAARSIPTVKGSSRPPSSTTPSLARGRPQAPCPFHGWRPPPSSPTGESSSAGASRGFVNPMDSPALSSAEIYDPATGMWTVVAPLSEGRFAHTATTLADGRVLVAFGSAGFGNAFQTAEVYDPVRGTWTSAPGAIQAHYGHTASL